MKNPKARQAEIVVQEVFDELVIYDLAEDRVHSLNPTAAFVWQQCDGRRTPAELAALLQQKFNTPHAEPLLALTLDRLATARLLKTTGTSPTGRRVLTRREMLRLAGVGLALLPVIASIVAPTAAQANSPRASGASCGSNDDCHSEFCKPDGTCM